VKHCERGGEGEVGDRRQVVASEVQVCPVDRGEGGGDYVGHVVAADVQRCQSRDEVISRSDVCDIVVLYIKLFLCKVTRLWYWKGCQISAVTVDVVHLTGTSLIWTWDCQR